MFDKKKYYAVAIAASILFITYLHYSTIPAILALHDLYLELYYVPVLLGALAFGLKGGLLTFLFIFALYLPYVFMSWSGTFLIEANKFLHLLLQGLFAVFAGYLIDRDRRQRELTERERYLSGIGRIATEIVHDLKSPLFVILGFAERIKEGKGKTDAAIQFIINSAEQMQKIVNSVLDFARPIRLELKEEDILDVVRRASDACRIKAEQKGVGLAVNLPLDPARMPIDSVHMERAMVNLILNAVEASGKGQPVSIAATVEENILAVRIKDQGPGMDRETLENIFLPFFTKKSGGTGLGMPIAKKIIEGHQGRISIESRPGWGTVVTIELPYRAFMGGERSPAPIAMKQNRLIEPEHRASRAGEKETHRGI